MARRLQFSLRTTLLLVFVIALLVRPANKWIRTYVLNRGLVSVKGQVFFKGQPLPDAKVLLVAVTPGAKPVQGVTNAGGTYETLATPGSYAVGIVEVGTGKRGVSAKYATPSTSGLTVSLGATGENYLDFDVTK